MEMQEPKKGVEGGDFADKQASVDLKHMIAGRKEFMSSVW